MLGSQGLGGYERAKEEWGNHGNCSAKGNEGQERENSLRVNCKGRWWGLPAGRQVGVSWGPGSQKSKIILKKE